jgi:acyl-CoA thioesterase-2
MSEDSPREDLGEILRIEPAADGTFRATLEDFWGEVQCGDLLARAALAASVGCEDLGLEALHASFLRPIPPGRELLLRVNVLGDERGIARREVRIEAGVLLGHVLARFAPAGAGPGWQDEKPPRELPDPDRLPSTREQAQREGWPVEYARGPVEFRRVSPEWPRPEQGEPVAHVEWMRPRAQVADDARAQLAAFVFLAGFYLHWPFENRIGRKFAYDRFTPLDHALWLHGPVRWNDWLLLESQSFTSHAGRALAQRRIYTRDGRLVATCSHSALVAST